MSHKFICCKKNIRNLGFLFPIVTFFLGFYICFLYQHSRHVSGVSFADVLDKRIDFVPQYYPVDAAGAGIWCSPVKTRLSGSAVLLVHVTPETHDRKILVVIEKIYRQGQLNDFVSMPMGFYDPEHANEQYNAFEVMEAEKLIYESNLKGEPVLVSDAYRIIRESYSSEEKALSYKPDDNLTETAFRETREETGLDLSRYKKTGQLKKWKLLGTNETRNTITLSYYGEIYSQDLPVLKPQSDEITMAAWVSLDAISLSDKSVIVDGVSYTMRKDMPSVILRYLSFLEKQ